MSVGVVGKGGGRRQKKHGATTKEAAMAFKLTERALVLKKTEQNTDTLNRQVADH